MAVLANIESINRKISGLLRGGKVDEAKKQVETFVAFYKLEETDDCEIIHVQKRICKSNFCDFKFDDNVRTILQSYVQKKPQKQTPSFACSAKKIPSDQSVSTSVPSSSDSANICRQVREREKTNENNIGTKTQDKKSITESNNTYNAYEDYDCDYYYDEHKSFGNTESNESTSHDTGSVNALLLNAVAEFNQCPQSILLLDEQNENQLITDAAIFPQLSKTTERQSLPTSAEEIKLVKVDDKSVSLIPKTDELRRQVVSAVIPPVIQTIHEGGQIASKYSKVMVQKGRRIGSELSKMIFLQICKLFTLLSSLYFQYGTKKTADECIDNSEVDNIEVSESANNSPNKSETDKQDSSLTSEEEVNLVMSVKTEQTESKSTLQSTEVTEKDEEYLNLIQTLMTNLNAIINKVKNTKNIEEFKSIKGIPLQLTEINVAMTALNNLCLPKKKM